MQNILIAIAKYKKTQVEQNKKLVPVEKLKDSIYYQSNTVSLARYIQRDDKCGIIAEFKRKSPSKPDINLYANPEEISMGYMQSGACALSILTDNKFFGGGSSDLTIARKYNYCPILRKDFIIDTYQIHEAKSIGADSILLIAEILTAKEVKQFCRTAKDLGLEVLLELHSKEEIEKITAEVDIVGVNNRDLKSFRTDINNSIELYEFLPEGICKISESGIKTADQMIQLKNKGFDGFLIGEQFMSSPDPIQACAQLISEYNIQRKGVQI